MNRAVKRGTVRYAPGQHSRWRRLRSAPVLILTVLGGAAAWGAPNEGPKAAVLELRVAVGGAPADFGLAGARMLASALGATGRYDVIDHVAVEEEVRKRGLRPPFAVGHLQLLADAVGADAMVHGSVRGITYDADAGSASVILSIEVVDGKSGQLEQRQQASGTRSAQVGVTSSQQQTLVAALAAAVEAVVEALTGREVTAAVEGPSPSESATEWPLGPALLPPMEVASDIPKTDKPRTDLSARSEEPPQPVVAVVRLTEPAPDVQPSVDEPPPAPQSPEIEPQPAEQDDAGGIGVDVQPLVEAKVLAKLGPQRVLITLGKDGLVEPKMELEVFRVRYSRDTERTTKSRIGKLRVVKINPTDAEARILEGAQLIRTGDRAYYYGP